MMVNKVVLMENELTVEMFSLFEGKPVKETFEYEKLQ